MSILLVEGVAISWMRTFVLLIFLQPVKWGSRHLNYERWGNVSELVEKLVHKPDVGLKLK